MSDRDDDLELARQTVEGLLAENAALRARVEALESAMNPQDVADVDAALREERAT